MQRTAIHRCVKENGWELIHEQAYVELQPDRVLPESEAELLMLNQRASEADALVLYVDFSREIGWRRHIWLQALAAKHEDRFLNVQLYSEDRERFKSHFSKWRNDYKDWLVSRDDRQEKAVSRIKEMQAEGLSWAKIAQQLNDEDILSLTGKPWTSEGLRKYYKRNAG